MRTFGIGVIGLLLAVLWWMAAHGTGAPPAPARGDELDDAPTAAQDESGSTPLAGHAANSREEPAALDATGEAVRGRLLQEGAPLAGRRLRLLSTEQPTGAALATTTTDAAGRFAFAMPDQRFVVAGEPGEAPRHWCSEPHQPRPGALDLGDVHVPASGRAEIRVRDRTGAAIGGARLHATASGWGRAAAVRQDTPLEARTDARGLAHFDGMCPGAWHVQVDVDGRRSGAANFDVLAGEVATADVELWPARRHTGVLLDWRGAPLRGAEISSISGDGRATTDANGWFAIEDTGDGTLHVHADGHLERYLGSIFGAGADEHGDHGSVGLRRAVTLRGVVRGAGNAATTVVIREAPGSALDAEPHELLNKPLPVAADGTFVIEGLGEADVLVQAFATGVGSSAAMHVTLAGDTEVELTVATGNSLRVVVTDEHGAPLDVAELVVDPGVEEYPSLYEDSFGGVLTRILGSHRHRMYGVRGGAIVVPRDPTTAFACAAKRPGHLAAYRVLRVGEAPTAITLVLRRSSTVRGVVHGGSSVEYARAVQLWRVDDEPALEAARAAATPSWDAKVPRPRSGAVDANGSFVVGGLEPGAWRIALSRHNLARTRSSASEGPQPDGAVPLIDEDEDRRQIVDVTVSAGETADVELHEPTLGTLRGRVLMGGVPCRDVRVFASRPGRQTMTLFGEPGEPDWDEALTRSWTASQLVGPDGAFVFRYRDAGPVELRLRHERGAATHAPIVVQLPPPGEEVVRDVTFASGSIRGRVALERIDERERAFTKVVLYPPHKASMDPSYSADWVPAVAWSCSTVEFQRGGDGSFSFDDLPAGEWLVRVQPLAIGCDPGPLWQGLITVDGGIVELGDLVPTSRVAVTLRWRWREDPAPGSVTGIWLYVAQGTQPSIWAGTFARGEQGLAFSAPPGRYTVVPFGVPNGKDAHLWTGWGLGGATGKALAPGAAIELHADGTTTPAELVFTGSPDEGR